MRRLLPLVLILAAGCPPAADDKDDTGIDTETDTDTDDTVDPVDSSGDTSETAVPAGTLTTIVDIRRSPVLETHDEGDLLRIEGAVVVAVRDFTTDDNGFVVQQKGQGSNGGLYVDVGASTSLPAIGDVVTVVGTYIEDDLGNAGAPSPNQTRTELELGDAASGWNKTGTDSITPLALVAGNLTSGSELYESMLGTLTTAIEVTSVDADGTLGIDANGTAYTVRSSYFPDRTSPIDYGFDTLGVGDTFTAVTGVVNWTADGWSLDPVGSGAFTGYTAAPTDTGSGDTSSGDTGGGDSGAGDSGDTNDTDTFEFVDTGDTLDTGVDTGPRQAAVNEIRAGIFVPGQYLIVDGLTVTAVRDVGPASKYVMAQDPTLTENAGLVVYLANDVDLPEIGDEITVTGKYVETPTAATAPLKTALQLEVLPSDTMASWAKIGPGVTPTPIELTHTDLFNASCLQPTHPCLPGPIEKYEGMVVHLEDTGVSYDITTWIGSLDDFDIELPGANDRLRVTGWFYDLSQDYDVDPGDTVTAIEGPLYFQVNAYKPAIASAASVTGFVDN